MTLSMHCSNQGESEITSPSHGIDGSKNDRSPHKDTDLIGKTSIFSETSHFYGVAPDESTDRKATERKLHETQVKKL